MKHQYEGVDMTQPVKQGSVVRLWEHQIQQGRSVIEDNLFTVVCRPRLVTHLNSEIIVVDLMTSDGQIVEGVPYEYLGIAT
jgi:hypothetical protein